MGRPSDYAVSGTGVGPVKTARAKGMRAEGSIGPSSRGTRPTQAEVDAWADRERRRRVAWLAGPGEEERRDWTSRYRWRAFLGLEESRLGPLPEEVEQWAEREHKRRQEWMAGPSEAEQREWLRRRRAFPGGAAADAASPPEEALEHWVARERHRREQWLAGPSEEERAAWAESQAGGRLEHFLRFPDILENELPEALPLLVREAELAAKGILYEMSRVPGALWHHLTRAGKAFEEELSRNPVRRRVRY
ncbi:MAG TPA: hypothetical protein VFD92_00690 [Candidatus Binatia bacterium]|nr:hypothetical protein [Candidatus Binatia bacterium]